MASSPYLSEDLKAYLKKFKLEELINTCVNQIAKEMPGDPYSSIMQSFSQHASQDIEIVSISGTEIMSSEGVPVISVGVTARYLAKQVSFRLPHPFAIVSDNNQLYDEDRLNGKGMNKNLQFLKKLSENLKGRVLSEQQQIDKQLLDQYEKNQKKGLYVVNICSYVCPIVTAHLLNKPLYKILDEKIEDVKEANITINCLQGSKVVGSKCKPFKFLLIFDKLSDPYMVQNVAQAVRKTITSGKGGEAALKIHTDGSFICPTDTINDNLKILQDAINSTNSKDKCSIGISWQADNFYVPEQKKYELQNPKALLDTDQLIDYYLKLSTDKPLISYFEDPIVEADAAGWTKMQSKFKDSKVRIGSRKLYSTVENLKKNGLPSTKQDMPQADEAAIADLNSKKVALHMHHYRPYELQTLWKLLSLRKALKPLKTVLMLSDNNYETSDTSLVDVAIALQAHLVLAPPLKFDRINKLNRIREIIG